MGISMYICIYPLTPLPASRVCPGAAQARLRGRLQGDRRARRALHRGGEYIAILTDI